VHLKRHPPAICACEAESMMDRTSSTPSALSSECISNQLRRSAFVAHGNPHRGTWISLTTLTNGSRTTATKRLHPRTPCQAMPRCSPRKTKVDRRQFMTPSRCLGKHAPNQIFLTMPAARLTRRVRLKCEAQRTHWHTPGVRRVRVDLMKAFRFHPRVWRAGGPQV